MRKRWMIALTLALVPGCYLSHQRPVIDGGAEDAGEPPDAGPPVDPCNTVCETPSVIARVPISLGSGGYTPALLDAVVHRDELVVALLIAPSHAVTTSRAFSIARISRRTGEARIEPVEVTTATGSVGAGALATRGDTLTFVAAHAEDAGGELQPEVLVARWEGDASAPILAVQPLTDSRLPGCPGCFRRGASVALGENGAIVTLAGDDQLFVGRVALDSATVSRETLRVAGVVPNTALDARGDRRGSGLLTMGGVREARAATPSPAFAIVASESALESPIALPGTASDSVPHPWLHGDAREIVRFLRDDGLSGGRIRRYAIEGSDTVELGAPIATAGGLPPLAMASTPSAVLWVESSLAAVGEADLRVLAAPPASCTAVTPASVVHLPTPLASEDPRALAATEGDGRTYAIVLERPPTELVSATLVVFDLGVCRDGR